MASFENLALILRLASATPPLLLAAPVAVSLSACGSSDPGREATPEEAEDSGAPGDGGSIHADAAAPELESYLPWKEGYQWTYDVTQDGVTSTKVTTVRALERIGGTGPYADRRANRVETEKGEDRTVSWQALDGDRVLRYREQAFSMSTGDLALEEHWDPYKIHFDSTAEHTEEGASWLEIYEETKLPVGGTPATSTVRDRWTVLAVDEEVTVPAGTFRAIVVQKTGTTASKTYYYVRGIGKVKEEGGQLEELRQYEVDD